MSDTNELLQAVLNAKPASFKEHLRDILDRKAVDSVADMHDSVAANMTAPEDDEDEDDEDEDLDFDLDDEDEDLDFDLDDEDEDEDLFDDEDIDFDLEDED